MLKHEPHRVFGVFASPNPELLFLVKMPPTRLHTRPQIHCSLQNCFSQAHLLALSSENRVRNFMRAFPPQTAHSTVHVRPANFTGTRSPSVFDLQMERKFNGNLALFLCDRSRQILLLLPYVEPLK